MDSIGFVALPRPDLEDCSWVVEDQICEVALLVETRQVREPAEARWEWKIGRHPGGKACGMDWGEEVKTPWWLY